MATTKIRETNRTKKKKSSNRDFQMYHGHLHTHTDDVMSRDKHGICEWALLPLRVTL